jgi:hypothetical protein
VSDLLKVVRDILLKNLPDEKVQDLMSELTTAVGNGSVSLRGNVAESIILTGDNNSIIHQKHDAEELKIILEYIQANQTQADSINKNGSDHSIENEPLALKITPQVVDLINSRLAIIEEFQKAGQFSGIHPLEFNSLKMDIYSLKDINKNLTSLADKTDKILKEAVGSLSDKLKELSRSNGDRLMAASAQVRIEEEIKFLENFQERLRQNKIVAYWLSSERDLAEHLGQYALSNYPEIQNSISQQKSDAFYLSIRLLLEQLCNCLTWDRKNSLDTAVIPIVIDDEIYIIAFNHLKTIIPERLPDNGMNHLQQYIDYLIKKLPEYRHINMD